MVRDGEKQEEEARERAARTIQRVLVRALDPITLRPMRRPFAILRGGALVTVDAYALYDHICASGDTRDPVARAPLVTHELSRLARACGAPALPCAQDLHARHAAEVGRRELLGYLVDEFLHAEEDAFDILDNIHTVARADEMPGVMQQLRANSAVHHHTFETLDHLTAPWLAA